MDFKNRHPLNAIEGYESLSMLEALIPFVDYSLKLPLALFLKYSETKLILKCFQSTENLIRLGLHNPCNDPMDMICSLTGMSPDMLKMLFTMMDGGGNSMFSDMFKNSSDNSNSNCGFSAEDISSAMNMFQSMQSEAPKSHNHMPNHDTDSEHIKNSSNAHFDNYSYNTDSDHFDENIQHLFAEYDLSQAESFDANNNHYNSNYDDITDQSSPYSYSSIN